MVDLDRHEDAWDGALYSANSKHHRDRDGWFLGSISLEPTAEVLDLGCGTGEFTNLLADQVPQGRVLGIDGSSSQVARAHQVKRSNVDLQLGRLQDLEGSLGDRQFDAAISRATLHWLPQEEHPALLRTVTRHLRPGGFFRAEFGGKGQVQALVEALDEISGSVGGPRSPWFFPDAEEYRNLVVAAGLDGDRGFVRLTQQRRCMPTFEVLRGFLHSQAFVGYDGSLSPEARHLFRERAEARAKAELRRADGSYDLDFVRLDLLAFRPSGVPCSM